VDVHVLARQGWTVSAIARHLGHDRKTIRGYLSGDRSAGARAAAGEDSLSPFVGYLRQRLVDDPHVWATVLFDEVAALGFDRSYLSFTRGLRRHRLRPHCEPCSVSTGRDHAVIDHPARGGGPVRLGGTPRPARLVAGWGAGASAGGGAAGVGEMARGPCRQ